LVVIYTFFCIIYSWILNLLETNLKSNWGLILLFFNLLGISTLLFDWYAELGFYCSICLGRLIQLPLFSEEVNCESCKALNLGSTMEELLMKILVGLYRKVLVITVLTVTAFFFQWEFLNWVYEYDIMCLHICSMLLFFRIIIWFQLFFNCNLPCLYFKCEIVHSRSMNPSSSLSHSLSDTRRSWFWAM
jgi:hypothetical protein